MSAIIATQSYLCYFNQGGLNEDGTCKGPRADVQGGITASMAGGSWLAALMSGLISDRFGRKTAIQIGALIWVIGCIIVCASQDIAMLIVGRVINGFCVGICSAQVPVYISEIAPPSKRGKLVGAQQWAITWGIMVQYSTQVSCNPALINYRSCSTSLTVAPSSMELLPSVFLGLSKYVWSTDLLYIRALC